MPIIATLLIQQYQSSDAVAWYMVISAVLGFIAIVTAKSIKHKKANDTVRVDELSI